MPSACGGGTGVSIAGAACAQDGVDFYTMVKHSLDEGRVPIDMARLAELGELVWPGGGGKEIVALVEKAKAGEVPNPATRAK